MRNILILILLCSAYLNFAQCNDPVITDFECSAPSNPIIGALATVPNPFPGGINNSNNVGRYTDDGTQGFDAMVVDYGSAIDLSVNNVLKLKFYSRSSVQILAKLEGGTPQEIYSDFSQVNTWQELAFDFSASIGNGNSRLVLFVNAAVTSGTPTDFYYLDDILFEDTVLTPCEEPFITNFDCSAPSNPITGALATVANNFSGGINTSPNIGQYTDDGTAGFDALVIDYGTPIDLSVNSVFKIKLYSPSSIQILAKLEGGMVQEIFSNFSLINTWQELTFDFSASAGNGNTRLVLFFNPVVTSGTPNDIYYIDDLQFGQFDKTVYSYVDDTVSWTPNDPSNIEDVSTAVDEVLIQGGTAQVAGDIAANIIRVETGATLNTQGLSLNTLLHSNGDTNISGILTPNASQINSNGNITLKSSMAGTSAVADATNASFNGTITVERFIPASNRAYRLVSTPVQNAGPISSNWQLDTHITGTGGSVNGFDSTASNQSSMFTVNEFALPAQYSAVASTTGTMLTHGTGYLLFVRGDRSINLSDNGSTPTATTLESSGTLFSGTQSLGVTELNTGDFQAGGSGSSLVANPYQAPVDMEVVLNSSSEINQEFIHVYDPALGTRGAFVTVGFGAAADGSNDITNYTLGSNMGTNASPTSASRFLQAGSAAFVNTVDPGTDGTATPSIIFTEQDKSLSNISIGTFDESQNTTLNSGTASISMVLYDADAFNAGELPKDGLNLRFSSQYSNSIEMSDAYKATNLDENFASIADGKLFSIQSRAIPADNENVELSIANFDTANYTLRINVNELNGLDAFLEDRYLSTSTLLENNAESIVQFSVDLVDAGSFRGDRFYIAFRESVLAIGNSEKQSFNLFPNPVNDELNIDLTDFSLKDAGITVYNVLGQKVAAYKVNSGNSLQTIDVSNLNSGAYFIEVVSENHSVTQKIIVEKN
ncbi:MAG: T9SS type A sorting domain-containing protein [Nonlabens sp.]